MSSFPNVLISNVFNPNDYGVESDTLTLGEADLRYIRQGGPANVSSLLINNAPVDFSAISGVVAGTAQANKALILGSSGEIGTISSLTATSITGTLQTGAQGNITSLGTLSSLTIGGNLTFTGASRSITGLSSISATTITGAVSGSQTGITAVGTLSSLTVSGSITGTLSTAAQPNITSVGTLNGLTSSAPVFITATGTSTGAPVLSCSGSASFGFGDTIFITTTDAARIAYGGIFTCAHRFGDNGLYDFRDTASTLQMYAHTSFLPSRLTNSPSGTAINTATTVYIGGSPIDNGSGWVSIAKPYALYVADGNSYFAGMIQSDDSMISTNPVAGQLFSGSLMTSKYNLICRNNAIDSGQFAGIAFHNDVGGIIDTTPSAAIVSQRTSTTGYEASSIEFWTKSSALNTASLARRMMIANDGKISFGSVAGDANLNLLTGGNASFRFGSALSAKNCYTLTWTYAGAGLDSNRLSLNSFGTSNCLVLTANNRVCINGASPDSTFHVVSSGNATYGSWERVAEFWNDNATPIKAGIIIYNETGSSNLNGVCFGTYSNDPLSFMVNGSIGMTFNTSKRLNINRSSGPEASLHAGGQVWADEYFHSKQNVDGKAVYRSNWSQSNYMGLGTDATVGAMRLGTCDANFNWVSYLPVRGGSYTNASDRRIKKDIVDIPYGLAEILKMKPRKFAMRSDGSEHIGFVAQEMAEIIPECISGIESADDELNESFEPINPMGIDLSSLVSVLTKAIQEQQSQINELRATIAALK